MNAEAREARFQQKRRAAEGSADGERERKPKTAKKLKGAKAKEGGKKKKGKKR